MYMHRKCTKFFFEGTVIQHTHYSARKRVKENERKKKERKRERKVESEKESKKEKES